MTNEQGKETIIKVVMRRSSIGIWGGLISLILAFIGLVVNFTNYLIFLIPGSNNLPFTSLATIVIGCSFLFRSIAVILAHRNVTPTMTASVFQQIKLNTVTVIEIITAMSGLALGILALFGFNAVQLVAIAMLIFGCRLIIGINTFVNLNTLKINLSELSENKKRIRETDIASAISIKMLIGFAVIILGILSLVGIAPAILTPIAALAISITLMICGAAVISE